MSVEKEFFGNMPDGKSAFLFTLQNRKGIKVQVTNYGAKIVSAFVPDRNGNFDSVILGYSNLEGYIKGHQYLGATIGRVTNRIGNARFELDGKVYELPKNLGNHHLHGGLTGFDSILWKVSDYQSAENSWVEFSLESPHGDQGYPGNLKVKTKYTLTTDNSLQIEMSATTDQSTIVNMTNHAYFNLNGHVSNDIYKHHVQFFASNFLKANHESVPTGEISTVENTPLDFRKSKEIGLEINQNFEPIKNTHGYDQFLVLDNYVKGKMNLMAEVYEPMSGRVLQVLSTIPGMQFYTGNFFDTIVPLSFGKVYGKQSSFCIEPSYFPDAPNHSNFASIRLNPNDTYKESIIFKFSTK
ncbi:MAG: aldose epimerase family protein [Tenuifilaceae bacterium]